MYCYFINGYVIEIPLHIGDLAHYIHTEGVHTFCNNFDFLCEFRI